MPNRLLTPDAIASRYQNRMSQYVKLYITRQGQQFQLDADLRLCDMELVSSYARLVGEPGRGNVGTIFNGESGATVTNHTPYRTSVNALNPINDAGTTSTVYNFSAENRILQKTHIDHGIVNVFFDGIDLQKSYVVDNSQPGNEAALTIPTDLGLYKESPIQYYSNQVTYENVRLQERVAVNCVFAGTWPQAYRVCRFTEDWADVPEAGVTKRNTDGTIRYFPNDDEGQASTQKCQVPANCIDVLELTFRILPRLDV